jgi:hypothetical protein
MSRYHTDRTPTSITLSGDLKDALRAHAYERCRHFFSYVYTAKMLADYVNARYGLSIKAADVPEHKATDQVDSGLRSTDSLYYGFDAKDPNVVNMSATACGKLDAAHFCNLGIDPNCRAKFGKLAASDKVVERLFEALKVFSGNTRWLPQRINIGPDRVIDRLHYDLAVEILAGGRPPVTKTNLRAYLSAADKALADYAQRQAAYGNAGLVNCVNSYRACYANDGDSLWGQCFMNVVEECRVVGARQEDYVTLM